MGLFKHEKVKTRFAPSPTGFLHVGGLRTALYAYIFAKQNNGGFVLRVEDTDQTREVEGAVESLLKSLKWAGLEPDEGVLLDSDGKVAERGNLGPYTQSKRVEIYQKYAQELVNRGHAYYCFCSSQRLEKLRKDQQDAGQPTHYDRECLKLTNEDTKKRIEAGEKYVIRMKVPEDANIEFNDGVRGRVVFNTKDIDDQIILKTDGFPTYHLASVIDDHLMEITHVIRGEEWLPSTPKHILLYNFFDWKLPEFVHIPLILNPDKTKLSKRQGDVAVEDYIEKGYLPEALINFIALLGWNPGTDQEVFSLEQLIEEFDSKKIHKSGAVFDHDKLDWMNGEYIKKINFNEFKELVIPFLQNNISSALENINIDKLLKVEKERISKLSEAGEQMGFVFTDNLEYKTDDLIWKKSDKESTVKNLKLLVSELEKQVDWSAEKLEKNIIKFIADNGLKNGDVLWPMRFALTGEQKSPTPFEVAEILGKEKSIERLKEAIDKI
jgi:nondiscriminating glutamyl-tRNA synthetase